MPMVLFRNAFDPDIPVWMNVAIPAGTVVFNGSLLRQATTVGVPIGTLGLSGQEPMIGGTIDLPITDAYNADPESVIYIREGGSGDGSSWSNALDDLPTTLVRGKTYAMADGSYGSKTFTTAVSGSTRISVIKATIADHGTETGWDNAYGDGVATFPSFVFDTNYITVNGNGSNFTTWGIEVVYNIGSPTVAYAVNVLGSQSNLTLQHMYIHSTASPNEGRGFRAASGGSNFLLSNVRIGNFGDDAIKLTAVTNSIFEYIWIDGRGTTTESAHADGFELQVSDNNNTIRYSLIDFDGQQVFWDNGGSYGTWYIYGNVFYGGSNSGKGPYCGTGDSTPWPTVYLYNNTFYNLQTQTLGLKGNGDARNNLFYNTNATINFGGTHDYNAFQGSTGGETNGQNLSSDPFTNAAGDVFTLTGATTAGDATIGATYNEDLTGATRGTDGTWDRGAYEYDAS